MGKTPAHRPYFCLEENRCGARREGHLVQRPRAVFRQLAGKTIVPGALGTYFIIVIGEFSFYIVSCVFQGGPLFFYRQGIYQRTPPERIAQPNKLL